MKCFQLMFKQIFPTNTIRTIWRIVRRTCVLILGSKRLNCLRFEFVDWFLTTQFYTLPKIALKSNCRVTVVEAVLLLAILFYCAIKQLRQKRNGGFREQTVSQALLWYICCCSFPAFGPMFVFVTQQSVQWINLSDISVVGGAWH